MVRGVWLPGERGTAFGSIFVSGALRVNYTLWRKFVCDMSNTLFLSFVCQNQDLFLAKKIFEIDWLINGFELWSSKTVSWNSLGYFLKNLFMLSASLKLFAYGYFCRSLFRNFKRMYEEYFTLINFEKLKNLKAKADLWWELFIINHTPKRIVL